MKKRHLKKQPVMNKLTLVAGIFSVVLLTVLAISSIFLQKRFKEESFDLRKEAAVPYKMTEFSIIPDSDTHTGFVENQEVAISLAINTGLTPIDGAQFFVNLDTAGLDIRDSQVSIESANIPGLDIVEAEIIPAFCDGCYGIRLLAITTNPASPYNSGDQDVILATIRFTPQATGSINLTTDEIFSQVMFHNEQNDILLKPIHPAKYTVRGIDVYEPNPISWQTEHARLSADDFYIMSNGQRFEAESVTSVTSDPPNIPSVDNTTLEVRWTELGVEMRYYLYFIKSNDRWYIDEMRTYNGNAQGDWIYYTNHGHQITGPDGTAVGSEAYVLNDLTLTTSENGIGMIYFENLRVQAFLQPDPPQCSYQYTDWSTCSNGWQQRSYTTQPDTCHWFETEALGELSRSCGTTPPPTSAEFMTYSWETCWHGESDGATTLLSWSDSIFSDVTWIDVSEYSDFRTFAHKNIENATTEENGYLVTNALGFFWNNDTQNAFRFSPNRSYYFRLYNGSHGPVTQFFMHQCSGVGGGNYQYCNESCGSNRDCASNLTCYNNQCRLVTNVSSSSCIANQDQGLNRTCNEYCSDSSECSNGYSCWWNRCRNTQNLEDTACRALSINTVQYYYTAYTPQVIRSVNTSVVNCSESCNTNNDCAANFRCYQNECRLAANPLSKSCNPSEIIVTNTSNVIEKGGNLSSQDTEEIDTDIVNNDENDDEATSSASITSSPTKEPYTYEAADLDELEKQETLASEETAFDAFKNFLDEKGISLQMLGIIAGGIITAIIVLILLSGGSSYKPPTYTGKKRANPVSYTPTKPIVPPAPSRVPQRPPQQPIATPTRSSFGQPIGSTPKTTAPRQAPTQTHPTLPRPIAKAVPQKPQQPRQQRVQVKSEPNSDMLRKLRSKGIKPPSNN